MGLTIVAVVAIVAFCSCDGCGGTDGVVPVGVPVIAADTITETVVVVAPVVVVIANVSDGVAADTDVTSKCDSSSRMTLLSAADGMVGRKRTLSRGGDDDRSVVSSWTACCRTSRGLVSVPLEDCIEQLCAVVAPRSVAALLPPMPPIEEGFAPLRMIKERRKCC